MAEIEAEVPEKVWRALLEEARRQGKTPAALAGEIIARAFGGQEAEPPGWSDTESRG